MDKNEIQIATKMFTTRTAAKMYLVEQGKPVNFAKAAVDESFNYEPDGDIRDLMYVEQDGAFEPSHVSAADLIVAYNTMEEMFTIENNQICIDGEPLYNINGDHLVVGRSDSELLAAAYEKAMQAMGAYLAACELYNTPTEELNPPEWYDRSLVVDRICENEDLLSDIVKHLQAGIKAG